MQGFFKYFKLARKTRCFASLGLQASYLVIKTLSYYWVFTAPIRLSDGFMFQSTIKAAMFNDETCMYIVVIGSPFGCMDERVTTHNCSIADPKTGRGAFYIHRTQKSVFRAVYKYNIIKEYSNNRISNRRMPSGVTYDFSFLSSDFAFANANSNFFLHVCGALTTKKCGDNADAGACEIVNGNYMSLGGK